MNIEELKKEFRDWRFNRYKLVNLTIGASALFVLELVARPYYRPYIYSNQINDFHIADTLGNSLGTIVMIFILLFLLSSRANASKRILQLIV